MEPWQIVLLGVLGVVAGWLNVMAGGGSMLTVPVMVFMGLPAPVANGTNRIGILVEGAAAVFTFFRKGYSDFKLSLSLAAVACLGAVIGAQLGVNLDGEWFNRFLAVVIVGVMILMATGHDKADEAAEKPLTRSRLIWGHVLMVGAGFWGGLIQVGVGFILMPVLHRVMGLDMVRMNMHKVFIVMSYTSVALIIFASQVEIYWSAGIALAIGMAAGGWLGAHSTIKHGATWIRRVLYVTLTVFCMKLLFG
ncbi:MAG: sulfite exporter TauE/SafE family protein [Gammaproteobacteria bacterium]